jgi:hypothetical protein
LPSLTWNNFWTKLPVPMTVKIKITAVFRNWTLNLWSFTNTAAIHKLHIFNNYHNIKLQDQRECIMPQKPIVLSMRVCKIVYRVLLPSYWPPTMQFCCKNFCLWHWCNIFTHYQFSLFLAESDYIKTISSTTSHVIPFSLFMSTNQS